MLVRFTPFAEADINEIWFGTAIDDRVAADRVVDRIIAASDRLRIFPQSAPPCPETRADLRMLVVRPWLFPHLVEGSTIGILRVVDGRRDRSSWQADLG